MLQREAGFKRYSLKVRLLEPSIRNILYVSVAKLRGSIPVRR